MNHEQWTAVDNYIHTLFIGTDAALEAALRDSAKAGLPEIQVSPAQGKLLQLLARATNARRILEIGTLGGYSTIWLGRALPEDGKLITLEIEAKHAAVAQANIARAGLAGQVEIMLGPAQETLARLTAERTGPFDLVFIDADKPGYADYLGWALRLTRRGSLIVADNVVRKGEIANANSQDANVRGVRRFIENLGKEPRVSATVIQTVGSKGYDGLAVGVVVS